MAPSPPPHPTHRPSKSTMSSSSRSRPPPYRSSSKTKRNTSINQLNKKIRDATRLLHRPKPIAADVRMEIERAKTAYEQDLAAANVEKRRQKMIRRYHKVRFFERRKATRRLNQLRKRLGSAVEREEEEERERLQGLVREAEVDLNYTLFCPLDQKYVALYVDGKSGAGEGGSIEEEDGSVERVKPPLWKEVERRMQTGGLEELRNGAALVAGCDSASTKKMSQMRRTTHSMENGDDRKTKPDKRAQHPSDEEEDEESDGGFFE